MKKSAKMLVIAAAAGFLAWAILRPPGPSRQTRFWDLVRRARETAASRPQEAERLARRALAIAEAAGDPLTFPLDPALHVLSQALERQGKYSEAEKVLNRMVAVADATYEPHRWEFSSARFAMATFQYTMANLPAAEEAFRRVVEEIDPGSGQSANHLFLSASIGLVHLYVTQGKILKAEPLLNNAWSRMEDTHAEIANTEWWLAFAQLVTAEMKLGQGKNEAAEALSRRSAESMQNLKEFEASDMAMALFIHGAALGRMGRHDEAVAAYERGMDVFMASTTNPHPLRMVIGLGGLAEVRLAQGRPDLAESLYREGLERCTNAYGPDHWTAARQKVNLAGVRLAQGHPDEAAAMVQQALPAIEDALGPSHPYAAEALVALASAYLAQDKDDQAEPLLRRALEIREKHMGPDNPRVADVLESLAMLLSRKGDEAKSREWGERSAKIRERHPHPPAHGSEAGGHGEITHAPPG